MTIATAQLAATQTITTTEHSLTTDTTGPDATTTDGAYQLFLGVPAAATYADTFELRMYETVNGVQYKFDSFVFRGCGAAYGIMLPIPMFGVGWDITLIKLTGTDRDFAWHFSVAS